MSKRTKTEARQSKRTRAEMRRDRWNAGMRAAEEMLARQLRDELTGPLDMQWIERQDAARAIVADISALNYRLVRFLAGLPTVVDPGAGMEAAPVEPSP